MTDTHTAPPTTIPALGTAFPATAERLIATYERARADGLDIRGHHGPVNTATHAVIAERIRLLDAALQPDWGIARLKASIPMRPRSDSGSDVPLAAFRRSLDTFADAARAMPSDAREAVNITTTITAPSGATELDVAVEATSTIDGDRPGHVDAAICVFAHTSAQTWCAITRDVLGAWLLASGVTELQITGQLGRHTATRH